MYRILKRMVNMDVSYPAIIFIVTLQLLITVLCLTVFNKMDTLIRYKMEADVAFDLRKEIDYEEDFFKSPFEIREEMNIMNTMSTSNLLQTNISPIPKIESVEEPILPKTEIYIVNVPILNIRESNSEDSQKLSEYYKNQLIEVIEKEDNWYKTTDGWVCADYLLSKEQHNENIFKDKTSRGNTTREPVHNNGFTVNSSVLMKSNLTEEDIRLLIAGTELEGIEAAIIDVEEKYGINALFTLAVARLESGNGTSRIAQKKNNLFGINAIDGNAFNMATTFDTKSDSVYYFGDLIKNKYVDKGLDTIQKINKKYCTSTSWASKVTDIMKKDSSKIKR